MVTGVTQVAAVELLVAAEHHVQRDDEQKYAEDSPECLRLNSSGAERANPCTKEKSERDQKPNGEIDVSCAVIAQRREQSDWRQKDRQGRSLCLML